MLDGEEAPDQEWLLWNESSIIPNYYKPYFKSKRVAFVANANELSSLWNWFLGIDKAWTRAIEDCGFGGGPERCIPIMLHMTGHAKVRVSVELAFAGCLGEARSIMRDAIEFVAHAHRLHVRPDLQPLWYRKEEKPKEWKEEFWEHKQSRLLLG